MPAKTSYRDWLKQEIGGLIDSFDLSNMQKHFLHSRWLDQVLWMEGKANSTRDRYYGLRLTAIIGGVIVPALVSLQVSGKFESNFVSWTTFGLSLLVAVSIAVEEFFHYGERWRHYRRTVEMLKIEGWQFFQLIGPYRRYKNHDGGYPVFATRVEEIIRLDVEKYITEVVREKEEEKEKKTIQ